MINGLMPTYANNLRAVVRSVAVNNLRAVYRSVAVSRFSVSL